MKILLTLIMKSGIGWEDIREKVGEGKGWRKHACARAHTGGRGDISQKERSPREGACLQGPADDNLKRNL